MSMGMEDNAFTRLAEDVRRGEVPHLKAGHLLPGDTVRVKGWPLVVESVERKSGMVLVEFSQISYAILVPEDQLVEVERLATSAPCSTRGGGLWL